MRDGAGELIRVPADEDYERRYGGLAANTSLWLNINLSPHFPSIGPVAAALYEAATDVKPDLVMRLDMVAIGWLLEAFPPVEVEGSPLDPTTIATDFIIDSYLRFPDPQEQNEYLGRVVSGVVATALESRPDGPALLRASTRATSERRMSVWSGTEAVQRAVATAHADGAIPAGAPGNVFVTIQNFAANKIDLYTETSIKLQASSIGCIVAGTATISITNAAPAEAALLPGDRYGTLGHWWVNVYLPKGARAFSMTVNGVTALGDLDEEQGRTVIAALVTAGPGTTGDLEVTWTEPHLHSRPNLGLSTQPMVAHATVWLEEAGQTPALMTTKCEE